MIAALSPNPVFTAYYTEHTGDIETLRELWPNIEAALGWIDGPGDPDRDGFVEYHRADENGLVNQGWKDSHDAIFHADGQDTPGWDPTSFRFYTRDASGAWVVGAVTPPH